MRNRALIIVFAFLFSSRYNKMRVRLMSRVPCKVSRECILLIIARDRVLNRVFASECVVKNAMKEQ